MHQILDYLYLGDIADAENLDLLIKNNIGAIVSVDMTNPSIEYKKKLEELKIIHRHHPIYGCPSRNIIGPAIRIHRWMINWMLDNPNKNILIHCKQGQHRSASIILIHLLCYPNDSNTQKYIEKLLQVSDPYLKFKHWINKFEYNSVYYYF